MANTLLPKRKSLSGSVPSTGDLQSGELAVNTADGRLYTKLHSGVVVNLPAQSLAGQTVPGSVQFGPIGNDSIKVTGGGNAGLYRVITLQPNTLAGNRTINLPDANCDLACTFNGNTISSGLTVNQKVGSLRNNLGDPTAEEMALFHGQYSNKFRFLAPTLQEESTDGTTWTTSTRMSTSALGDLMIGEGQGTGVNVIPSAAVGTYGGYRLTWDVVAQTGYVFLNFLYIYSCACGNNITCTVEKYNPLNDAWSTVHTGTISNYPGHTSIKHDTIAYHPSTTSPTTFNKVRITFESTQNANTNAFTLYAIEWFGGYPGGQRRNAESYDRDKNVTFPARIRTNSGGSDADCSLSVAGRPSTGINFIDTNTLDFVTNGGKRMRVATGGVGIGTGTTTPIAPLHIIGTTGASGFSPITVASSSLNSAVTHISTPNNSTYPFLAATNGGLVGANYGWGFFDSATTGNLEIKRRNGSTTWVDAFSISRSTGAAVVSGGLSTTGQFGVGAVCRSNLTCDLGTAAGLAWSEGSFLGMQFSNADTYRLGLSLFAAGRETRVQAKTGDASGKITFYAGTGATEHARIHTNGYLGIGTNAPQDRIHANGGQTTLRLQSSTAYDTQVRLIDTQADWSVGINPANGAGNGKFVIRSNTASAYRLTIDDAGRVGIGTTAPQSGFLLDVNGASVTRGNVLLSGDVTEFANSRFKLNGGTGSAAHSYASVGNGNFGINNSSPDAKLTVKGSGTSSLTKSLIVENSAGTDIFTVRDDGRVGINQGSPGYTLDVTGTVFASTSVNAPTIGATAVNADTVNSTEVYVGGSNAGFFQMMNSNADSFFEVSESGGLWSTVPIEFAPATSASPSANGNVVFERASNTALNVKLMGTDGVVRSGSIALASGGGGSGSSFSGSSPYGSTLLFG